MDVLSGYFSNKIEHTTSSLYSHILLWTDKLAHSPNNPKQVKCNEYCHHFCNTYYGLETLVHSEDEKLPQRIVHCYNKASTTTTTTSSSTTTTTTKSEPYSLPPLSKLMWSSSPPPVRSTVLGDLIGTESGDYMSSDLAEVQVEVDKMEVQSKSSWFGKREMKSERKRELPPLITLMRQTGRMPWSFKKEYNEYGRLIISVERVTWREHVEAHRENCRLTIKLVHDDDDDEENNIDCCEECGWPIDEEECFDDDEEESDFEFEQELDKESNLENEGGRCMDLRECVSYTGSGELVKDCDSFWTGDASGYLGRPSTSAPLQPMTSVM